jgi:hypothetical protein
MGNYEGNGYRMDDSWSRHDQSHAAQAYDVETTAPEQNWGVWIGRFVTDPRKPESERYHPKWESHPFLLLPDRIAARYPNKEATFFNSQSSTQVIGEIFIHILRSPMPNLIL